MGHESPIEPWLAADNRAAWESPNRLASSRQSDENPWQKKPTALREASSVRDHRTERQNNPAQTGWAGSQEKIRPQERCFFLDSFYRTNQELGKAMSPARESVALRQYRSLLILGNGTAAGSFARGFNRGSNCTSNWDRVPPVRYFSRLGWA